MMLKSQLTTYIAHFDSVHETINRLNYCAHKLYTHTHTHMKRIYKLCCVCCVRRRIAKLSMRTHNICVARWCVHVVLGTSGIMSDKIQLARAREIVIFAKRANERDSCVCDPVSAIGECVRICSCVRFCGAISSAQTQTHNICRARTNTLAWHFLLARCERSSPVLRIVSRCATTPLTHFARNTHDARSTFIRVCKSAARSLARPV